jgi:hypothetical protein
MTTSIEDAKRHAQDLMNKYYDQKKAMEEMDAIYFMEWEDKPTGRDGYKFTTSPSGRNALLGAIRLMTSTEPIFSVPFDKNNDKAKAISEHLEKFCSTVWYHSGRFKGIPLEQPIVDSLLRYGMYALAIFDTKDLYDMFVNNKASKAKVNQLDRLVKSTPYFLEAWDPRGVYPEWGRFGMEAVYRNVTMTVGEVIDQFGEKAVQEYMSLDNSSKSDYVQYADYWDLEKHIAWISASTTGGNEIIAGEPLVDKEHDLPCIPIVVQTGEGSYIDNEPERQAIPFLYTLKESGLWERQNLELTMMYTNLFDIAANPSYVYKTVGEDNLVVDHDVPGSAVKLRPGEDYYPLQKDVINKDMLQGLSIADRLVEESTLYRQALGGTGNLGANVAFSTVSLLNQVGRLPLTAPQKRGGWGIATACEYMFEMLKDRGSIRQLKTKEGILEFDPKEIPDDLIVEAKLEVDLPQDQMNQANIAQLVTQAGLASRRWARENILNIGQSEAMDKEIWDDQASSQVYQMILQNLQQQEMMKQQQQMMMAQQQQAQAGRNAPQNMPNQQPQQRGPVSPGSAMQAQAGLTPSQRPGTKPAPPTGEGMPMQEGEM